MFETLQSAPAIMAGIPVTWYEGITVDDIVPILGNHKLEVKRKDKLHNVMRNINCVLSNPEELRATTQIVGDDQGYAHSNPQLRSEFAVIVLQLSKTFNNRKPNSSYLSAPFT